MDILIVLASLDASTSPVDATLLLPLDEDEAETRWDWSARATDADALNPRSALVPFETSSAAASSAS